MFGMEGDIGLHSRTRLGSRCFGEFSIPLPFHVMDTINLITEPKFPQIGQEATGYPVLTEN